MYFFLVALMVAATSSFSIASEFSEKSCENYSKNSRYTQALEVVSKNMKFTRSQLCSLPRLMDVYIVDTDVYNLEKGITEPHIWVTLHYNEYSCQYFVRTKDLLVTKRTAIALGKTS